MDTNHCSSVTPLAQDVLALPKKQGKESRVWRALRRPPGLFCCRDSHGGRPERQESRAGSLRPTARETAAGFRRCRSPCAALRQAFACARCSRLPSGSLLRPLLAGGCASQSARHPDTPAVACQCLPLKSGCPLLFCSLSGKKKGGLKVLFSA